MAYPAFNFTSSDSQNLMLPFFHWIYIQHWLLEEINVSKNCVRTTGSLLQLVDISWCRRNIQHYMSAHTDFINILMENLKQEILPIFLLAGGVYITLLLNWLYLEVIANIKCQLSTRVTQFHEKRNAEIYFQHFG